MNSLSVVIIGFNEAGNFRNVIDRTEDVLQQLNLAYEIIVVNDGSTDETREILDRACSEFPRVRAIHHPTNQGIGASLRDGYLSARMDLITCLAADGQIDPVDVQRLAMAMDAQTDFVTSVYTTRRDSILRDVLSAGYRIVLFLLFGPLPRFEGSYMFRRSVLEGLQFYTNTFVFNYELIIKACKRNARFAQISTSYKSRKDGKSKVVGLQSVGRVMGELLKLRWILWKKGV